MVRIFTGWGLVTNLNDNYGWGLWKGFNTLVGIALGASGFTTAFAVYMLGREKFHPVARIAVLVGILGYLSSVFSLLIDLGHPDRIIFPVVFWNPESPLFEVAWCVMLYLTVMILEFSPAVLNRLGSEEGRRDRSRRRNPSCHRWHSSVLPASVIPGIAFPQRP